MSESENYRVRFAPSPTGYLHIGGARTAMYCWLIAKAQNGKFVLRIEDTDLDRSKKEYETAMIDDLKWMGIDYDEGPDKPGNFGPYRQSERNEIYQGYAKKLIDQQKAYYCFLTETELEELTQKAISEKKPPHYYHNKYRNLSSQEVSKRIAAGEDHVIRFINPNTEISFIDGVRAKVTFPPDMVGDFVIIRSNGMPIYNFCCAIDDYEMRISHVIRGEEHLNNTLRQLLILKALDLKVPEFFHVSLLVGEDRQKLSKRHGSTSVRQYRDQHYLPQALANYLCLLGWSHPEEKDIFTLDEIIPLFSLNRFSKSSAFYDIKKLNHFNAQHIKNLPVKSLINTFNQNSTFSKQTDAWKKLFVTTFQEKLNSLNEIEQKIDDVFNPSIEKTPEVMDVLSWESTTEMKLYLKSELEQLESMTEENITQWMDYLKKERKIKGKNLFMGMRVLLSGKCHGPDLKPLLLLTPLEVIKQRINSFI